MRNCEEITRLLSKAEEEKLTLPERIELKFHLFMCKNCRQFAYNLKQMRLMTKNFFKQHDDE